MAYQGVTSRFLVFEASSWYEVKALKGELRALRGVNFAIQASRDQALQRLAGMPLVAPFSAAGRFPAGELWVCEDFGDWGRKFQQLRTALTHKDLAKDAKVREGSGRSSDLSDNLQAYHNALTSMSDQLSRLDGVFDQGVFESTFRLQWVEPCAAPAAPAQQAPSQPAGPAPAQQAVVPQLGPLGPLAAGAAGVPATPGRA